MTQFDRDARDERELLQMFLQDVYERHALPEYDDPAYWRHQAEFGGGEGCLECADMCESGMFRDEWL